MGQTHLSRIPKHACVRGGGAPANGTEYHIIICILYSHFSQGLRVCVYGYVARICVCVCVWVCV